MTKTEFLHAKSVELPPVNVKNENDDNPILLRSFTLSLRSTKVELCSLGASITKFCVGNDDIVLGYKDPETAFRLRNPKYFGVVVGRVANRIAKGKFLLGGKEYSLETNNGPNHLHGGSNGFSNRNWDAEILPLADGSAVRFCLTSPDTDEGYPGEILVSATYSLRNAISPKGVVLRLELDATLVSVGTSPINLAQHSYFNLSRHDDPRGILDHRLSLNSSAYTPVDETSIPTREVRPLGKDPTMDWRRDRNIEDALKSYAVEKHGLGSGQADEDLAKRQPLPTPYGFDHNYVVLQQPGVALPKVGTLSHAQRKLNVYSNSPGVQLYTANYLDESDKPPTCKGFYGPWSGLCLETQHFPDSIDDNLNEQEFAVGKCTILTSENQNITYEHIVEYNLEFLDEGHLENIGSDTAGQSYTSIEEMWAAQDLTTWYSRAKDYYEENCSATVDGVLGGIGEISDVDLEGSRNFLKTLDLPKNTPSASVACDHGAGIGRVTKGVLLEFCDQCDLFESSAKLLYAAPDYIGSRAGKCRFYNTELQDWSTKPGTYTIVWIQWVACYLRDDDLVKFLQRCAKSLVPGGVIVIKENTCANETFVVDLDDASLTRSYPYWLDLIHKAGLVVHKIEWQKNFPEDIFPVLMVAIRPRQNP